MSTTSSTASTSSAARDAMKEAKDGARDAARAASAASGDVKSDFDALRSDVAKLTQQMSDILGNRGNAVWERAKSGVDGVISDVENKGQEAVEAVL